MPAKRYVVSGKVQGVFFRAWTRDQARRIGLAGWVRNRADGTVEALASGDKALLARFEEALHEGPPLSRVARVAEETLGDDAEAPTPFEVWA